jgi:very-short-patch-repair endonuclease
VKAFFSEHGCRGTNRLPTMVLIAVAAGFLFHFTLRETTMNEKRHRIKPVKLARAKDLRREATVPEQLLWYRLRGRQVAGLKFRRQYVVGPYIVDFYCSEKNTAIEIDGRSHNERQEYDKERTRFPAAQGIRVLRYSNDDVIEDADAVAEAIAVALGWKDGDNNLKENGDNESGNAEIPFP